MSLAETTRSPTCQHVQAYALFVLSIQVLSVRSHALLRILGAGQRPQALCCTQRCVVRRTRRPLSGDPFLPAVLPAPKETNLRPGAALPSVLFTEALTHIIWATISSLLIRVLPCRLLGSLVLAYSARLGVTLPAEVVHGTPNLCSPATLTNHTCSKKRPLLYCFLESKVPTTACPAEASERRRGDQDAGRGAKHACLGDPIRRSRRGASALL